MDSVTAWSQYWSEDNRQSNGGCLPGSLTQLQEQQKSIWTSFAQQMPRKGRVLDLACGDGDVIRTMLKARSDLKAVGVDSAEAVANFPKGARLRPKTNMEKLPFGAQSFNGITSQFGFEYGDSDRIIKEIARVLKVGGLYSLIVHVENSAIVESNLSRKNDLDDLINGKKIISMAQNYIRNGSPMGPIVPPVILNIVQEAEQTFGRNSVRWQFSAAVAQTLQLAANTPIEGTLHQLKALQLHGLGELKRISELSNAGLSKKGVEDLKEVFDSNELTVSNLSLMKLDNGKAFAWSMQGRMEKSSGTSPNVR